MKTERLSILAGILVIILLAFLIIWKADIIGVSESRLEQDAREKQHIAEGWKVVKAVNGELCAMLFYDERKQDCRFSIYQTRDGMSYGYFFSEGGADGYMLENVRGMMLEERGIALMSLNCDRVSRIEVDNGEKVSRIEVDPDQPFVVLLQEECGEITMYDVQGQVVTLYDTFK